MKRLTKSAYLFVLLSFFALMASTAWANSVPACPTSQYAGTNSGANFLANLTGTKKSDWMPSQGGQVSTDLNELGGIYAGEKSGLNAFTKHYSCMSGQAKLERALSCRRVRYISDASVISCKSS